MAKRKRSARSARSARNVVTDKITRVTTKSPSVVGRPGYTETGQQRRLGTIRPFKARSVKTLIKKDIAKGVTQPEAKTANTVPGQVTPATRAVVTHQVPQVPPSAGTNTRVITPPSPTQKAGVRSPFNPKRRVGRGRGKSTRFKG